MLTCMTTYDDRRSTAPSETTRVLLLAIAAGAALGLGDVLATMSLPWTLATAANSSTFWAAGAFGLGIVLGTDALRAALGGVVMMTVAVAAYYAAAARLGLSDFSPWSGHSVAWMVIGVPTGVLFGVAGAWIGGPVAWKRLVGTVTGLGLLLGGGAAYGLDALLRIAAC